MTVHQGDIAVALSSLAGQAMVENQEANEERILGGMMVIPVWKAEGGNVTTATIRTATTAGGILSSEVVVLECGVRMIAIEKRMRDREVTGIGLDEAAEVEVGKGEGPA